MLHESRSRQLTPAPGTQGRADGAVTKISGIVLELRSYRDGDTNALSRLHDRAPVMPAVHGGHGPGGDVRNIRATYLDSGGEFLVGFRAANRSALARAERSITISRARRFTVGSRDGNGACLSPHRPQ